MLVSSEVSSVKKCSIKFVFTKVMQEVLVWAPPQISNDAIALKINTFLKANPAKPPYERFIQDCISSHWPVMWHLKIEHKILIDKNERVVVSQPDDNEADNEDDDKENCAICYNNLNPSSEVLSCGHCFHTMCIYKWLKRSNTCPMCRATICT